MFPLKASARLADLRRLLTREPSSPLAWYWELQIRVLTALIALYGDYASRLPWSPVRPFFLRTPRLASGTKSRAEISELLHRIAVANGRRN